MRSKLLLLSSVFLFIIISCSESIPEEEQLSFNTNEVAVSGIGTNLTENEAAMILLNFMNDHTVNAKSSSVETKIIHCKRKIVSDYSETKESTKLKSMNNNVAILVDTIPIYEFTVSNNENEGFALVCGNSLYNDVLAYVPNGSLADTIYNKGLALFMASMPENISSSIEENYSFLKNLTDRTKAYWQDNDGVMTVLNETEEYLGLVWGEEAFRKICPYDRGNGPWTEFKQYGSPIYTEWGQEAPYNNKVTLFCSGVRAKIGCGPVAISQIINHHRVGSYNWGLINSTPKISSSSINSSQEVSRLMINVFNDLGTIPRCKDDGTSAASTSSNTIVPTLNKFGLTGILQPSATTIKADTVRNNVSKNMPVMMMALTTYHVTTNENLNVGHLWIVDALSERYKDYYYWLKGWDDNDNAYYKVWRYKQRGIHVHCNWGWDGSSDGWYRFFRPVNTIYRFEDYRLITQIHPK